MTLIFAIMHVGFDLALVPDYWAHGYSGEQKLLHAGLADARVNKWEAKKGAGRSRSASVSFPWRVCVR